MPQKPNRRGHDTVRGMVERAIKREKGSKRSVREMVEVAKKREPRASRGAMSSGSIDETIKTMTLKEKISLARKLLEEIEAQS
jgi:phage shock protein A